MVDWWLDNIRFSGGGMECGSQGLVYVSESYLERLWGPLICSQIFQQHLTYLLFQVEGAEARRGRSLKAAKVQMEPMAQKYPRKNQKYEEF